MSIQNMFGVVLWSDRTTQKAVIWCEDQGELAFYTQSDSNLHNAPVLDAGDLIQFEVTIQERMRRASNPQLLESCHSPDLPRSLRASQRRMCGAGAQVARKVVDIAQYLGPDGMGQLAQSA